MEHREVKERFKIDSCEVFAVTKGNSSLICNCEAVVKVSEISRTFRTLHGTEYVAKKKVYSIIVCQKPEHNLTFEELEKIERFDIDAILIGRYEREHFAIRDIAPKVIDLNGDWVFSLSEKEGRRLHELHVKVTNEPNLY